MPRRALALLAVALISAQGPLGAQAAESGDDPQELPQACPKGSLSLKGSYWVPSGGVRYEGDCVLRGDPEAQVVGAIGAQVSAGGDLGLDGSLSFTAGGLLASLRGSVVLAPGAAADLQGWRLASHSRHVALAGNISVMTTGPLPALAAPGGVFLAGRARFWQMSGPAISAAMVSIEGEANFSSIKSSLGAINAGSSTGAASGGHVNITGTARFENCSSSGSGGAIFVNASRGGWVDIPGSAAFVGCTSAVSGGAIAAGSVRISGRASFRRCSALVGGGAISSGGGAAARSLDILGSVHFSRCSAVFGSAVASSQLVEISGSAFFRHLECRQQSNGSTAGSILFLQPGSSALLSGLIFEHVSCGTAIWAQAVTNLTLTDSLFNNISQGSGSPIINADVAGYVDISNCSSLGIQSFLTAQYTGGIYMTNVAVDGCGTSAQPDLACVDVSTEVSGTGSIQMLRFRPESLPVADDGVVLTPTTASRRSYTLYRGLGTVAAADDRSDITASCPPGTFPTWMVKKEVAFSTNTSVGGDCSFSQPEGCCMLHYNGWGICKRAKYTAVTQCTARCTCLQTEMLANHGCTCKTCKTSAPRYAHDLSCSPCPDGHISMAPAVLNTNDLRHSGTYANNTCISCSRTFDEDTDVDFDCSGAAIEAPAGVMVMKEGLARAALKTAKASVTCAGGICAFHCSNPTACLRSRTMHADYASVAPKSMCARGHDESFPGCSRCAEEYGRSTYDPFVCKRCGVPWLEWVYWVAAPFLPFGLGMRSACGLGGGGEATNEERRQRRERIGMANSVLKILISFCVLCSVVFQSLQATPLYNNTEKWLKQLMGYVDRSVSTVSLLSKSHDCLLRDPMAPMWQWLGLELASVAAMFLLVFLVYMLPGLVADIRAARQGSSVNVDATALHDSPFQSQRFGCWRSGADVTAAAVPGRRVRSLEEFRRPTGSWQEASQDSLAGVIPTWELLGDRAAAAELAIPLAPEGGAAEAAAPVAPSPPPGRKPCSRWCCPLVEQEEEGPAGSILSAPPVPEAPGWRDGRFRRRHAFRRRLIRTTVVLGNTMLPALAGAFLRLWPCAQVQHGTGRSFVAYGLDEPCSVYVFPPLSRFLVGLVGLLFCLAAGPVYWWWLLGLHWRVTEHDPLAPAVDYALIGYLTKHYNPTHQWWEVTVLLRKFVLVTAVAIVPASYVPESHLHVPLVTITVALVMHVRIWPYADDRVNRIETASLTISLALLLLASWILYPSWNEPDWVMYATLVLVLGLMSATVLTLTYIYVKESLGPQGLRGALRSTVEAVRKFPERCRHGVARCRRYVAWLWGLLCQAVCWVGRLLSQAACHVAGVLRRAMGACRTCAVGALGFGRRAFSALCCVLGAPCRAVVSACRKCVECLRGWRLRGTGIFARWPFVREDC